MSNSSYFDFHCSAGANWYACSSGSRFVGCCASDPCTNGCAQGNIRPAAYNISHYGEWPDASCGSASNFYACNAENTFWGCCKSNACAATPPAVCSSGELVPAFMERPEQLNVYASVSPSPTPVPASTNNTGAIVGGAVGGVAVLVIVGLLIFFLLRKKRRNQMSIRSEKGAAAMVPMMSEKPDARLSAQYSGQSPPPTYFPAHGLYHDVSPTKGHPPCQQYSAVANGPQELPAEIASPTEHRYSELPAESLQSMATHRFSELLAGTARLSELESPYTSPMPLQTEFLTDMAKQNQVSGLGSKEALHKK